MVRAVGESRHGSNLHTIYIIVRHSSKFFAKLRSFKFSTVHKPSSLKELSQIQSQLFLLTLK